MRINWSFQGSVTERGDAQLLFRGEWSHHGWEEVLAECRPATFNKSLVTKEDLPAWLQSSMPIWSGGKEPFRAKPSNRWTIQVHVQQEGELIASFVVALQHVAKHCDYGDTLCWGTGSCGVQAENIRKVLQLTKKDLKYALEIATGVGVCRERQWRSQACRFSSLRV